MITTIQDKQRLLKDIEIKNNIIKLLYNEFINEIDKIEKDQKNILEEIINLKKHE